jgi:hypothetical protein
VEHFDGNRCDEDEPTCEDLPDDTPFSVVDWFGPDYWYMVMPLARLITEQTAPTELLAQFGQPDTSIGLDYEQATWFDPLDRAAIEHRLRELGHHIIEGPEAQAILDGYDYRNNT